MYSFIPSFTKCHPDQHVWIDRIYTVTQWMDSHEIMIGLEQSYMSTATRMVLHFFFDFWCIYMYRVYVNVKNSTRNRSPIKPGFSFYGVYFSYLYGTHTVPRPYFQDYLWTALRNSWYYGILCDETCRGTKFLGCCWFWRCLKYHP